MRKPEIKSWGGALLNSAYRGKEIKFVSSKSNGIITLSGIESVEGNKYRIYGTFKGTETNRLFSAEVEREVEREITPFIVSRKELDNQEIRDFTCG
jgi:hypothetical protein